ncbi:MAG: hypothetical protein Q4B47_03515 [Eubacteriales bacterium]|nr:hypothetical protein [Eubacteriales bacterium]
MIRIRDKYYTMPVPVSTLIADGWTIRESETAEYIKGNGSDWVGLQLEGQYMHTIAKNFNANAVTPENAWVTEMTFGESDLNLDAEFSGGIRLGMSEAELLSLLENTNLQYEKEESGDYFYYVINMKTNESDEQRIVSFYQGESGYHDIDSAYAIEIVDREPDFSAVEAKSEETEESAEETGDKDNAAAVTLLDSAQALVDAGIDQNKDSIKVILEQIKTSLGDSNANAVQLLDSAITLLESDSVDAASVSALLSSVKVLL